MINYYRLANLDTEEGDPEESFWVCEDCFEGYMETGRYEHIDTERDRYHDRECFGCGIKFIPSLGEYYGNEGEI